MKIGRYVYDSPDDIVRKTYGIDRGLTVVLSSAYDAGIIGSEYNGIAVLDDDHGEVVLDRFAMGQSRDLQRKAFERVVAMSWKEMNAFIRNDGRTRSGLSGADLGTGAEPTRGDLVAQARSGREVDLSKGQDIRTPEMVAMHDDPACPLALPLRTRAEMEAFLTGHAMHGTGRGYGCALAWDVKVHSFDTSGKTGEKVDERLDGLWNAHAEADASMFYEACSDALRSYHEGEYTTYPGDDQGRYGFRNEGRSGGWLILSKVDGHDMEFKNVQAMREWVSEMTDVEVADAYKLVASVDHDTRDPGKDMAYAYSFIRTCAEERWKDEPADAIKVAAKGRMPADEIALVAKALGMSGETLVQALKDDEIDEDLALDVASAFGGPEAEAAIRPAPVP